MRFCFVFVWRCCHVVLFRGQVSIFQFRSKCMHNCMIGKRPTRLRFDSYCFYTRRSPSVPYWECGVAVVDTLWQRALGCFIDGWTRFCRLPHTKRANQSRFFPEPGHFWHVGTRSERKSRRHPGARVASAAFDSPAAFPPALDECLAYLEGKTHSDSEKHLPRGFKALRRDVWQRFKPWAAPTGFKFRTVRSDTAPLYLEFRLRIANRARFKRNLQYSHPWGTQEIVRHRRTCARPCFCLVWICFASLLT